MTAGPGIDIYQNTGMVPAAPHLKTPVMTRAGRHIYEFMDDHLGIYDNPQGIEFCMNTDDSIFVIYNFNPPPEEYVDFGLLYNSTPFSKFLRDFKFAGTKEVKALSPEHLWKMYYAGKVEIFCTLCVNVIFHALYYRISRRNTMIVRDDYDNRIELPEVLTTPRQFVEFTQQHFLMTEG